MKCLKAKGIRKEGQTYGRCAEEEVRYQDLSKNGAITLESGVARHEALATVMMSPQGFRASPYLPGSIKCYVKRPLPQ